MNNNLGYFARAAISLSAASLSLAGGVANATLVEFPTSALNDSPGVYTAGGYYTDDLGPNIVTTGGGNAANVGAADGRNDDGFMSLSLGFDVTFFDTTYNSLFINNNGNVSFGDGISAFIPTGPTGATAPVISPFFGDVDTRDAASGVVHYNLTSDQLVVTWDEVGYFSQNSDSLNSFQLVLRSDDYAVPTGEGAIGFFYEAMGWTLTDTSTTAAVGFGDGAGDGNVLEGSPLANMHEIVDRQYIWFDPELDPVTPGVPAPGTLLLLGAGLLGVRLRRRCS